MRSISVGLTHVAAGKACVMELVTKIALKTRRLRATEIAAKQQQIDKIKGNPDHFSKSLHVSYSDITVHALVGDIPS